MPLPKTALDALLPMSGDVEDEWAEALKAAEAEAEASASFFGGAPEVPQGTTAVDEEDLKAKAAAGEKFVGVLTKFDAGSTRGFINCEAIKPLIGGKDVYVHQNVVWAAKARVGDTVEFGLHFNGQGMPQASAPCKVVARGGQQAEFIGSIKSFSHTTGYGFINCPQIKEAYGRDAYLPYEKACGFYVGQEVSFNVSLNREQMPIVSELYAANAEEDWDVAGGKKGGKDGGKGKDSWGGKGGKDGWGGDAKGGGWGEKAKGKGKSKTKDLGPSSGPFSGHIKSFSEATGYGFIECEETRELWPGKDVFAMKEVLEGFCVGQAVTFKCAANHTGSPQATEVWDEGGDEWAAPAQASWGKSAGGKGKGGGGGDVAALADENAELKARLAALEAAILGGGGGESSKGKGKGYSPY